jgi:chromate transport protein ChrA
VVIFGSGVCGILGSAVALIGLLGAPMAIVLVIAFLYDRYGEYPSVRRLSRDS